MSVDITEKVFKVRDQRSRLQPDQMHFFGGGIHFDGVASRLTCFCRNEVTTGAALLDNNEATAKSTSQDGGMAVNFG